MAYNLSTNEWDPLFYALFREAIPQMEGYFADLGHDTLMLSHAQIGERFLWGVRKTGTELKPLPDNNEERFAIISRTVNYFTDHRWYLLTITNRREHGYVAGVVDPLPYGDPMHHEPDNLGECGRTREENAADLAYEEAERPPSTAARTEWYVLPRGVTHLPTPEQEARAAYLQQLIDEDPFKDAVLSPPKEPL